jgi:hypothetical protein
MHLAFRARVTYASDFLGTLASAQFADCKLTHTNASLLSAAKTSVEFPTYLTGFPENNEKKQGEHNETDSAHYIIMRIVLSPCGSVILSYPLAGNPSMTYISILMPFT